MSDLVGELLELHFPRKIYDECDHDHTDEDIEAERAVDTGDYYSCAEALMYVVCGECCMENDYLRESCLDHTHTPNPNDRCPTVQLIVSIEGTS